MRFLYLLGIQGMYATMWIAALFHQKAKKWIIGRKNPGWKTQSKPDKPVYWFHCASLGEFDQGLPVMNALKAKYPESHLLVTFFSPSGMDFWHKRENQVDEVQYLPLDTPSKAKAFMEHYRPEAAFFVKYEIWYFHLKAAANVGAKIYGVSSMFRPKQRFFKWYGKLFREALQSFTYFFTQNTESLQLLASIGIRNAALTGDTRYDRMTNVVESDPQNEQIAAFKGDSPLLILGSSWPEEEQLFFTAQKEITDRFKVLIAPHDINSTHVSQIAEQLSVSFSRYTENLKPESKVLILDTIGQLTSAYRYADVAFVGGGFSGKLHNILEPGAFGVPVIFGPLHRRFPEAALFLSRNVAVEITKNDRLLETAEKMLDQRKKIAVGLEEIFSENKGAAEKIVNAL